METPRKPRSLTPITFDIGEQHLRAITRLQKETGSKSVSATVRSALTSFDWKKHSFEKEATKQISIRLNEDEKSHLAHICKVKKASVGEVIRAALESLPQDQPKVKPVKKVKPQGKSVSPSKPATSEESSTEKPKKKKKKSKEEKALKKLKKAKKKKKHKAEE